VINSLESWLEAASELFASQSKKLNLFHERQIYSEYWVQNELATLLPWDQPGIYIVDCGAPLVSVTDKKMFPDFTIQFGTAKESPLYFIELKDLITNSVENIKHLRNETADMAQMDREATKAGWGSYTGKKARQHAGSMIEALGSSPIQFYGLAVGPATNMPAHLKGYVTKKISIIENWDIGVFRLVDPTAATCDNYETNHETLNQEGLYPNSVDIADALLPGILEAVQGCEDGKCQTAAELPIITLIEAQLLAAQIELQLRDNTQNGLPIIRHAKPWVWSEQSSGSAMTESGRNAGIEIRFSYYNTTVR